MAKKFHQKCILDDQQRMAQTTILQLKCLWERVGRLIIISVVTDPNYTYIRHKYGVESGSFSVVISMHNAMQCSQLSLIIMKTISPELVCLSAA